MRFFFVLVLLLSPGCDGEAARKQRIAEANEKIARACTPELGEERVLRWTINSEGHYALYVTIRQPVGQKGRNFQFVIVSEDEIR